MNNEYYVYLYLREDGSPYYVGKGKGRRAYTKDRNVKRPPTDDRIIIPLQNLTEEQAFANEKDFISFFGRKDNNTGILWNFTDGGEGKSGIITSDETRKKMSAYAKNRTEQHVERYKKSATGKKRSEEACKKMSEALRSKYASGGLVPWNKGLTKDDPRVSSYTDKRKQTLDKNGWPAAWNKGKTGIYTKETLDKMKSFSGEKHHHYGKKRIQVTCTHCGKVGGVGSMSRYHFDKCSQK